MAATAALCQEQPLLTSQCVNQSGTGQSVVMGVSCQNLSPIINDCGDSWRTHVKLQLLHSVYLIFVISV